ncbi:beta-N-acetylhexosaminidase [Clostridium thermopalmarium]|uniref:beta-N-acetylhexosaminidase n=1 Tax=Clostridium thermopalmarium DSM 5974 TaxID=1121340 RepID=A0A2T0AZE1_9CLOT|nr:beta-N-acetylhexosaminidase [Clostridium thermopalmarium]PRR76579.1 putative lipoprotein YbbD precursor [Clostridium thermopalmarium DSM 5974]PVZ28308.1 beta-N-acetylhexosaminidase [Clostridium thermopalmarium DSM 5974]
MVKKIILLISIFLLFSITGCSKENVEEKIGIRGEIKKISLDDSGRISRILVEGKVEQDTQYDKASIRIKDNTKIYEKDAKKELEVNSLKEGAKVEVIFEGPVAESYPVQADAKTIIITEQVDPIKEKINAMTLDEKIGQMFIVGIDGYDLNDNSKSLIEKYKVGGFILFKDNIKNVNQLLSLINSLKVENSSNKIPLFLSVDEEGGKVTRMPDELKSLPTNKVIGKINDVDFSNKIGKTIAGEIKAFGFNMNFAPVLDINNNPKNPVIGSRSFGSNPDIVTKLGIETMKGIQSENVIPVVKHFPGHGDTSVDSHIGLPIVNNDLKRLEEFELIPFAKAIENEADAVMIAHILLPKVDEKNPSSMSKIIITDILRNSLKFNGVVITDDMTMGAITKNYNINDATIKSIKAGSDIVLICHGYDNEIGVINYVKNAVLKGEITEERIDESVYRILKLKEKYDLKDEIIKSVDVEKINNDIKSLLYKYKVS